MVRKSLLIAALLAVASPLAAQQEELVWTSKRPDGQAPLGIIGDRTLDQGQLAVTYRFSQLDSKGIWFQHDSLGLDQTLQFYPVAPLSLNNVLHQVVVEYAPTSDLTLVANIGYSQRHREQYTTEGIYYATDSDNVGDLEIRGLYNVFRTGAYVAQVSMGAVVPTGKTDISGQTRDGQGPLPYDMRPGSGTFGVLPGVTVQAQNDKATVGLQMRGTIRFGENNLGYTLGNEYESSGWAAYRLNDYFAVTARAHFLKWNGIDGADPALDPTVDPGNDGYFSSGRRLDLPLGLNLRMPEGTRFAGHSLSVEWIFPVSQKYDGPQLGADWGVVAGWQVVF